MYLYGATNATIDKYCRTSNFGSQTSRLARLRAAASRAMKEPVPQNAVTRSTLLLIRRSDDNVALPSYIF